ncbi:MAG: cell wall-binding repeat-containing protein [Actinomycetota bacterium]|nr:cell wall-binding repeat-containing protein [Actinomycetota bacterium]
MKNERKRVSTRLVAGLLAVLVAGAGLALTSGTASGLQTVTQSTRVSGVDKYATSASAAITSHNNNATASVLVSGESYADALSAAALAGAVSGPVILTDPDTLKGSTSLAIGQINSTTAAGHTVYIVGGTAAVSAGVATSLTDLGYTVSRVSGADRVATADAVATKIRTMQDFGTNWDSDTTVFLTTARNFADAVAASGIAFKNVMPILLVEPGDALSAGTKAVLDSSVNSIEHVVILGGTAAVSAAVEAEVKTILNGAAGTTAIEVTRVGGTDRYDTAKKLMELRTKATVLNGFGETATNVILVNGTSHEDGMSATALAGAAATMTLLTDGTGTLNATTSAALTAKSASISTVRAIGRTADLSAAEMTAADAAATTTTVTCTISAAEGGTTMTVTFSGAVLGAEGDQDGTTNADGTGAGLETNYKLNNAALAATTNVAAGSAASGAVDQPNLTEVLGSTAAATASSITFGTAFALGDVLSASTTITDTSAQAIAGCSHTIANDATRPTATVDSFRIGATQGLLHFSEAVEDFASANNTTVTDDMTSTSSGTDTTFLVTQVGGTNYYRFTHKDGSAFISGQILTISTSAGDFTDLGDLDMAANKTATASTDTTGPTATASVASTTYTRAKSATLGTGGTFTIGAVAGGVAEGTLGNLWTFEAIEGTAGAAPSISLYDSVNRKIVLAADFTSPTTASTPTADNICSTVNGHADVGANFKCLVVAGGTSTAVVASSSVGAGTSGAAVHSIDVTYSELMDPAFATISYYTVDADADTVYTDDGAEAVRTAACTTADDTAGCSYSTGANSHIAGTMQFKYTATSAAMDITKGSSKLGISTSVTDYKGNAVGSVTYRVTIN